MKSNLILFSALLIGLVSCKSVPGSNNSPSAHTMPADYVNPYYELDTALFARIKINKVFSGDYYPDIDNTHRPENGKCILLEGTIVKDYTNHFSNNRKIIFSIGVTYNCLNNENDSFNSVNAYFDDDSTETTPPVISNNYVDVKDEILNLLTDEDSYYYIPYVFNYEEHGLGLYSDKDGEWFEAESNPLIAATPITLSSYACWIYMKNDMVNTKSTKDIVEKYNISTPYSDTFKRYWENEHFNDKMNRFEAEQQIAKECK